MQRSILILLSLVAGMTSLAIAEEATKPDDRASAVTAIDYQRSTVYRSPQAPRFTSWTGAWLLPDQSLMVSFTQATGSVHRRPKANAAVRKRLTWPPDDSYDMTGLDMRNVHLRSTDRGETWTQISADPFQSPMNGVSCMAEVALKNGDIMRGVWGFYLPFDKGVPQTGFLQRSTNRTRTWSKPLVLLDPEKYATFPTRLRVLRDGRLILLGGFSRSPATGNLTREDHWALLEPLMMVSNDNGKTWDGPLEVIPEELQKHWCGEEWDAAELPNGDLLCVFRRDLKTGGARWQGLLEKEGDRWKPESVRASTLPHLSHPELLSTQEGIVLHIAPSGYFWTDDAGESWHQLSIPGSAYYARSVQTADGEIYAVGHTGFDDGYNNADQSIVMDRFRLKK